MKLHADEPLARKATSYLNDVKVPRCVFADEEAGYIERWETNDQGRIVAFFNEQSKKREPRRIREYGTVRIEIAQ